VNERVPLLQALPLSLQHLFAMFGAIPAPGATDADV
jgi:xanthine/uracil permease